MSTTSISSTQPFKMATRIKSQAEREHLPSLVNYEGYKKGKSTPLIGIEEGFERNIIPTNKNPLTLFFLMF